jgi:FtsZ-binding cell division protein ZapB
LNPADFMRAFPARPVTIVGPSAEYTATLRRRKEVIMRLCTAVQDFLILDIDEALERAEWKPPAPPKPTIEQLDQAQREVEKIQGQLEALERLADSMPDETGDYMEKLQRPMLESQLKQAQDWLSMLQRAIETPEEEKP